MKQANFVQTKTKIQPMKRAASIPPLLRWLLTLIVAAGMVGCDETQPPAAAFEAFPIPPAPDYARAEHWSCLPNQADFADLTPPAVIPEAQATAPADVFFIHPTTYLGGEAWNAPVDSAELNQDTDERAVKHQASIFNAAGRVFAPRYRQMVLGGFYGDDSLSRRQALEVAYADVKAAFEYYLAHWNQGRPIILAGHSQGALHGMFLLREYFDGQPLQSQLVAAYLPGWPIDIRQFETITACNDPEQTGCLNSWCTWREGTEPEYPDFYAGATVTNPLNWRSDGTPAERDKYPGILLPNYNRFLAVDLAADDHAGMLWLKRPVPLFPKKNYHVADFNLFWRDVRQNAVARVEAFQEHTQAQEPTTLQGQRE